MILGRSEHNPNPREFTTSEEQVAYDEGFQQGTREGRLLGIALKRDILSDYDPRTGLLKKEAFMKELQDYVDDAETTGIPIGLAFLDIDGLKSANDTFGHAKGDEVIDATAYITNEVAQFMEDTLRVHGDKPDMLGRNSQGAKVGGDEFAIVAARLQSGSERRATNLSAEDRMQGLCDRVMESFAKRTDLISIGVGISVGYAVWKPGMNATELYKEADEAMYKIKRRKKS